MRAALLVDPAQGLELVDDLEVELPRAGEVGIRITHCGICHSDVSVYDHWPAGVPIVLGHEAAGVVEAVGDGVDGLAPGDRVVLAAVGSCGQCWFCARGESALCTRASALSTNQLPSGGTRMSWRGREVAKGLGTGGFAEHVVASTHAVVKVADDTPLELACLIGCAVGTGAGAVLNTARPEPGATIVVFGLGGVGVSAVQGARIAGATRVVAVDTNAARREVAESLGATHSLDPAAVDVPAVLRELTGGIGADYAIECAGAVPAFDTAIQTIRPGGTVVLVGVPIGAQYSLNPVDVIMKEKKIIGSIYGSSHPQRDMPRLLDLWANGRLDLEGMVTARRPLAEINAAFADLRAGLGIRTVLDYAQ
jgi:Zn-dependent alcohol dehydrogenase